MKNIFVAFLELVNVKHTKSFSDQYFNEHPHKSNLFGLSGMLSDFGIRNAATWIEDRENDISHIGCPFVAQSGGDFVVVEKVEAGDTGRNRENREGAFSAKWEKDCYSRFSIYPVLVGRHSSG